MMKRIAILATAAVFAMPASAQTVSAGAYKDTLAYAGCVVTSDPASARALLETVPESPEAKKALDALSNNEGCAAQGKPKTEALRGAIAERIYLTSYTAAPAEARVESAPFAGSGKAALANWDVTRCVATRDPVGADMLVRSELSSNAQKDAIKRISPVIGGCVPAGMQVGFDREKMRGLIAEGLLAVRGSGVTN